MWKQQTALGLWCYCDLKRYVINGPSYPPNGWDLGQWSSQFETPKYIWNTQMPCHWLTGGEKIRRPSKSHAWTHTDSNSYPANFQPPKTREIWGSKIRGEAWFIMYEWTLWHTSNLWLPNWVKSATPLLFTKCWPLRLPFSNPCWTKAENSLLQSYK